MVTPLHMYHATPDGLTDKVYPLDDDPATAYLSNMEIPLEAATIDAIMHTHSPLDALIEQETQSIRGSFLENKEWVWDLVEQELTARQLQIFRLRYIQGYSQGRIAEMLQLKGGQACVSQVLHNCEVRLRKRLSPLLQSLAQLP